MSQRLHHSNQAIGHYVNRKIKKDREERAPLTLTEKVRWRIENDRNPLFPHLLDKVAVRKFATDRGVQVPELLAVSRKPTKRMLRNLPSDYYLKASHGCGWNFRVKDGLGYRQLGDVLHEPSLCERPSSPRQIIQECKSWLKCDFSQFHGEWAYSKIPPRIFAEEILHQAGGGALVDYKCFAFDGEVALIYGIDEPTRWSNGGSEFRDRNWKRVNLTQCRDPWADPPLQRPEALDEILAAAKRLGKGLEFCRIDLYSTTKGVVFGEMTLYPQAGYDPITGCPDFDRWLGDLWTLPGQAVLADETNVEKLRTNPQSFDRTSQDPGLEDD